MARKRYSLSFYRQKLADYVTKRRHWRWTTLRRKATYGYSAAAVEKQLVRIELFGRQVRVHAKAKAAFERWHRAVRNYEKEHDLPPFIAKDVQCFNWRTTRGGSSLSRHAHAIAVDIDPDTNGYGETMTDLPFYVVRLATKSCALGWGGLWTSPTDSMHFELH